MSKKCILALVLILFALTLSGCYKVESIRKVKTTFENQELVGIKEIKDVIIAGKVKQIVSFPIKRYLLSSSNGERIWIVMDKDKEILPRHNEKIIVIGTANRFFFIGDVCIKERAHYKLSAVIMGILSLGILFATTILFIIVRKNKNKYSQSNEETRDIP